MPKINKVQAKPPSTNVIDKETLLKIQRELGEGSTVSVVCSQPPAEFDEMDARAASLTAIKNGAQYTYFFPDDEWKNQFGSLRIYAVFASATYEEIAQGFMRVMDNRVRTCILPLHQCYWFYPLMNTVVIATPNEIYPIACTRVMIGSGRGTWHYYRVYNSFALSLSEFLEEMKEE